MRKETQHLNYVRCGSPSIREEVLDPIILSAMKNMLDSDKFKGACPERTCPESHRGSRGGRWICMTDVKTGDFGADLSDIQKELENNREKQLKLTDLYLKNLLSEDTFKQKNESIRIEEEELRKKMAGIEILLLEKENSAAYLDRVKEFLASYESEKQDLDVAAKKEILGLILKKIIIKKRRNERVRALVSPIFYEPFENINNEIKKSLKEKKNCPFFTLKLTVAK